MPTNLFIKRTGRGFGGSTFAGPIMESRIKAALKSEYSPAVIAKYGEIVSDWNEKPTFTHHVQRTGDKITISIRVSDDIPGQRWRMVDKKGRYKKVTITPKQKLKKRFKLVPLKQGPRAKPAFVGVPAEVLARLHVRTYIPHTGKSIGKYGGKGEYVDGSETGAPTSVIQGDVEPRKFTSTVVVPWIDQNNIFINAARRGYRRAMAAITGKQV